MEKQVWPHFPWTVYRGAGEDAHTFLILTGTGIGPAGMAVGCWLSHFLRDGQFEEAGGLMTPPLVVANFGTAGAYPNSWSPGQSLLIHRIVSPAGVSIFPEMALRWTAEEAECRTVLEPQRTVVESDLARDRRPVFDMEAYGVAEATQRFLSTSHLLVAKYVLDLVGTEDLIDWRGLAAEHASGYAQECLKFLQFAKDLQGFLADDARRQKTLDARLWSQDRLKEILEVLPLTVTQQREVTSALMTRACRPLSAEGDSEGCRQISTILEGVTPTTKAEVKFHLGELLAGIRQPQSYGGQGPPREDSLKLRRRRPIHRGDLENKLP